MRSYKPEELFTKEGTLQPMLKALAPPSLKRMSANPVANGGILRRKLKLPDYQTFAYNTIETWF